MMKRKNGETRRLMGRVPSPKLPLIYSKVISRVPQDGRDSRVEGHRGTQPCFKKN